mgnify:CR=1 FL=1
MSSNLRLALVGVLFGFCLSRIGFSSWDQVNAMFRFSDLRLLLTFASAVGLLMVGWVVMRRYFHARFRPRDIHPGTLVGGLLFGLGWALSGSCPGIVMVQIGEGQLAALVTLTGIVLGNWLYSLAHERYFRWPTSSCNSD